MDSNNQSLPPGYSASDVVPVGGDQSPQTSSLPPGYSASDIVPVDNSNPSTDPSQTQSFTTPGGSSYNVGQSVQHSDGTHGEVTGQHPDTGKAIIKWHPDAKQFKVGQYIEVNGEPGTVKGYANNGKLLVEGKWGDFGGTKAISPADVDQPGQDHSPGAMYNSTAYGLANSMLKTASGAAHIVGYHGLDNAQQNAEQAQQQNPASGKAGELAGDLVQFLAANGVVKAGTGMITALPAAEQYAQAAKITKALADHPLLAKLLHGAINGALTQGAISGVQSGGDLGETAKGAALGAGGEVGGEALVGGVSKLGKAVYTAAKGGSLLQGEGSTLWNLARKATDSIENTRIGANLQEFLQGTTRSGGYLDDDFKDLKDFENGNEDAETGAEQAKKIYDAFQPVRDELKSRYGDTVPLYRYEPINLNADAQENRAILSFADKDNIDRFGRGRDLSKERLIKVNVPVDDIVAAPAVKNGYHEFIVKNGDAVQGVRNELDNPTGSLASRAIGTVRGAIDKGTTALGNQVEKIVPGAFPEAIPQSAVDTANSAADSAEAEAAKAGGPEALAQHPASQEAASLRSAADQQLQASKTNVAPESWRTAETPLSPEEARQTAQEKVIEPFHDKIREAISNVAKEAGVNFEPGKSIQDYAHSAADAILDKSSKLYSQVDEAIQEATGKPGKFQAHDEEIRKIQEKLSDAIGDKEAQAKFTTALNEAQAKRNATWSIIKENKLDDVAQKASDYHKLGSALQDLGDKIRTSTNGKVGSVLDPERVNPNTFQTALRNLRNNSKFGDSRLSQALGKGSDDILQATSDAKVGLRQLKEAAAKRMSNATAAQKLAQESLDARQAQATQAYKDLSAKADAAEAQAKLAQGAKQFELQQAAKVARDKATEAAKNYSDVLQHRAAFKKKAALGALGSLGVGAGYDVGHHIAHIFTGD